MPAGNISFSSLTLSPLSLRASHVFLSKLSCMILWGTDLGDICDLHIFQHPQRLLTVFFCEIPWLFSSSRISHAWLIECRPHLT